MFTGIIEEVGIVKKIVQSGNSIQLTILCNDIINGTKNADSIAVNGICLTIAKREQNCLTFDVMPETMKHSNIGNLKLSDKVNLERAVQPSDRLGGHIVSGHIDGVGIITEITKEENAIWLTIEAADDILKYMIYKGSITLDGISLTVSYVDEKCFKVSLIPFTREITSFGNKSCYDMVNIECDIIGKYVERLMLFKENKQSNITADFLKENGFF